MKLVCDLHIHSALSPCADNDMTPVNIVRMAKLSGLEAIAVTDHQSCGNCAAVIEAARREGGPVVLPGLEIETSEEIHLLGLFDNLPAAKNVADKVYSLLPARANKPEVFGEQHYFDAADRVTGMESRLLLQAARLDLQQACRLIMDAGGAIIAAHIGRESGGMLPVLGHLPPDYPGKTLELAMHTNEEALLNLHPEITGLRLIRGSDAHRLADLATAGWTLDLPGKSGLDNLPKRMIFSLRQYPV